MLSAEDIAAVKVALQICNRLEIKTEIFCIPGSDYDLSKGTYWDGNKKQWNEIVEKKVKVLLDYLGVPKQLQGKVIGIVLLVGMRMLFWAEYHEGTLGISRGYSLNFLNTSFFKQRGIIDKKKAAEELMKDESLNIKQKYKLACLHCFSDRIPVLSKQMTIEEKSEFYDCVNPRWIKQPELVKFWSYYLMSDIDKLKGEKNLDQYRLEKAVACGSKAAVQYCLERTNLSRKKDAIVDAAVEAIKCKIKAGPYFDNDRVVFCYRRYQESVKLWVPSDYYVDILSFLLSKMGEVQQIEYFKQDIKHTMYIWEKFGDHVISRVLECFLNWPYQEYFMEKAKLMWELLPERDYAVLLLKICDKINSRKGESLKYSEEKIYDYRALLKEFWLQSPEGLKRYVFSNQEVEYRNDYIITTKASVGLLISLLTLKNFANEDLENIKLILGTASGKEKEKIFSSEEWRTFCIVQMEEEKWEMLDRFVANCFLSKEKQDMFKKELCSSKAAKRFCIGFVENDKWESADTFIKWSALPEEEINKLKKEMIYSENGMRACGHLIFSYKNIEALDKFIRWSFPYEEDAKAFRRVLVFSDTGTGTCATLVKRDQIEMVTEFINLCLSSEEEVRELKKKVAYRVGDSVCEDLISATVVEDIYDDQGDVIRSITIFKGGKWEQVEKFITWCFSTEEEISYYKKNVLIKEAGKEIHFILVECNQWEEAETFFAWLGLSAEEIKGLKKDTLFDYDAAYEMFGKLMHSKEYDEEFSDYGSKQEAIELLLRWYLEDKETTLEFVDDFKSQYRCINEENANVLKNFDSMIEQLLRDLAEDHKGVKRKSETSSQSKRFCN